MAEPSSTSDAQLRTAIDEAARWFVRLQDRSPSADVRREWQQWLGDSAQNRRAWAKVEIVQQRFAAVPGHIALPALTVEGQKRRRAMRMCITGAAAVPLTWCMTRYQPWRQWAADIRTARGEIRLLTLPDGSQIALDTDSALNVAFDNEQRRLVLERGALYVRTTPDPALVARPFIVQTRHGLITALGTEFSVQVSRDSTQVVVNEHAVRIALPGQAPARLQAGYGTHFSSEGVAPADPATGAVFAAWRHGSVVAIDMPMGELVDRLKAYRPGYLVLDPALAHVKVSGVFPLTHSDRALAALASTYPVQIRHFTRYWTRIEPRA